MPFVPHTNNDIQQMLKEVNVSNLNELFDEIPSNIRESSEINLADGLNECQISRLFEDKLSKNISQKNFIGAGAYHHYSPSVVTDMITRGEFYTSYTPYQAESSQGTLQVIYEYQTMIASLAGLEVSNASVYDGATALAESVLMAVRSNRKVKTKKIFIADVVYPQYINVVKTITQAQGIEITVAQVDPLLGVFNLDDLESYVDEYSAVIIPQVNFYGQITDFNNLSNWAHLNNSLVVALVNPIHLSLLTPPGQWGEKGADISCGDGQPLGLPLSAGGPYFGFMAAKKELVRQMPGRIIGRTVDVDGNEAFCLTLQAREQHIRRAKATSNICSNQGLLVTSATVYMSLLGYHGIKDVALKSHHNVAYLVQKIQSLDGVKVRFNNNFMYEIIIDLPVAARDVLEVGSSQNIQFGYDMARFDVQQANSILVCSTEVHNEADLDQYVQVLEYSLSKVTVEA